ncbi:FAD-dependent monooxygenase [Pseudonocardia halophobica]|uniref:FAD-dependent monooxygenase n=1 Tax=Pseudonocardia halophobica TaxID=29401 RepID=UPI001E4A9291|nr:FAD-dependent monooxygenase [Pseudonocardia halophobica]
MVRVLVSGASVAGPVLAYWLHRYGFEVTVVEQAPALRHAGGHAVDLFRPALEIIDRMGLAEQVAAAATGTDRITLYREGVATPVHIDLTRLLAAVSDRHVEIMRDDLSTILHSSTAATVEYLFGDSITAIGQGGEVSFARARPRVFDVVIGADGLHSNVRRLVFGPETRFATHLGAYVAVASVPNDLGLRGEMIVDAGVGRMAGLYGARRTGDGRAVFLFRTEAPLAYHHRDVPRQKQLLRAAFAGAGARVEALLAELNTTPAFYFDSITQLHLDTWSRGRVSLVGDAGYCPGPAVGGSTSLAVVGAYVLAGELAEAGGDPARAFPAYEAAIGDYVRGSRAFARATAKSIVPVNRLVLWAIANGARLASHTPPALARALGRLNRRGLRLHDSIAVRDYQRRS